MTEDWKRRKIKETHRKKQKRYLLTASCFLMCDEQGEKLTESHRFDDTESGWKKATKLTQMYVRKHWRVAIVPEGNK